MSLSILSGCASAPPIPEPEGEISVIGHACDEFGIAVIRIVVTGPGVYTLHWENKSVCGYPT